MWRVAPRWTKLLRPSISAPRPSTRHGCWRPQTKTGSSRSRVAVVGDVARRLGGLDLCPRSWWGSASIAWGAPMSRRTAPISRGATTAGMRAISLLLARFHRACPSASEAARHGRWLRDGRCRGGSRKVVRGVVPGWTVVTGPLLGRLLPAAPRRCHVAADRRLQPRRHPTRQGLRCPPLLLWVPAAGQPRHGIRGRPTHGGAASCGGCSRQCIGRHGGRHKVGGKVLNLRL